MNEVSIIVFDAVQSQEVAIEVAILLTGLRYRNKLTIITVSQYKIL